MHWPGRWPTAASRGSSTPTSSGDGTLTAPNSAALRRLIAAVPIPIIASGGVAEVQQLAELAATGVEAAIVGRALYDGAVDLAAAIAFVREAGR